MKFFPAMAASCVKIFSKRELVLLLTAKTLREKHLGSMLGLFWIVYNALFPLISYIFIFFYIAGVKVQGADNPFDYVIFVFSGLLPWTMFNSTAVESVDTLSSNLELMKQAIFPVETLSLVSVLEKIAVLLIQVLLLVPVYIYIHPEVWYRVLYLPLFLFPLVLFCLGFSWIFSIAGFFLRDLKNIFTSAFSFLVFVSPMLYKPENAPERLRIIFTLNPITHMINCFRDILYNTSFMYRDSWTAFGLLSIFVFLFGYYLILSAKFYIGDMV